MGQNKSLYALYKAEYDGSYVYEDDMGFTMYSIREASPSTAFVYIEESYVLPQFRGTHHSAYMLDKCVENACKLHDNIVEVITFTSIKALNSERAVQNILKHGFKITSLDREMIYFSKAVKNSQRDL